MPDTSSAMPPVPCPDCMHPTEHDGDLFHCTGCGQAFSTPNGMDLSMWQELWRAWTAGRQVVDLPEPEWIHDAVPGMLPTALYDVHSYVVTAIATSNGPRVNVRGGPIMRPEEAEQRGAALIAAAREARRLAAGSGSGED